MSHREGLGMAQHERRLGRPRQAPSDDLVLVDRCNRQTPRAQLRSSGHPHTCPALHVSQRNDFDLCIR